MVIAVYCLTVKFWKPTSVGHIRADRTVAKKCHLNSLQIVEGFKRKQDVMEIIGDDPNIPLEQLDCREDTFKSQLVERTATVQLVPGNEEKVTNVGSFLSSTKKSQMQELLQ